MIVYYAAESYGLEEMEENEATVEIVEEIVIDTGSSDKEYSTQMSGQTNSRMIRDLDGEKKVENQIARKPNTRGKQDKGALTQDQGSEELQAMHE